MKTNSKSAFTMVELLIVAACLALLIGPIFVLLKSGSNRSRMGMLKIETTLESRKILKQLNRDLKMAVIPLAKLWSPGKEVKIKFDDILIEESTPPLSKYHFYCYPSHAPISSGEVGDIIENRSLKTGYSPRNMAKITYELEKTEPDNLFMTLSRTELYKGQTRRQILSKRVNYFRIKKTLVNAAGKNQNFFFVTLQLIDSLHRSDIDGKINASDVGMQKADAKSKIVLADFFDIVYPEYFHAFWNNAQSNPSWHTFPINLPD